MYLMLLASLIPHQLRRRSWAIDLGIDNNGNTVLISPDSVDASYYQSEGSVVATGANYIINGNAYQTYQLDL